MRKRQVKTVKINQDENLIAIPIKRHVSKQYCRLINEVQRDQPFKLKKKKRGKKGGQYDHVIIEVEQGLAPDKMIGVGSQLEQLKYRATTELAKEKRKSLQTDAKTIEIQFPKKFAKDFSTTYKEEFKLERIIGTQGEKLRYVFNIDHVQTRQQLVSWVLRIVDAVNDIKGKKVPKMELDAMKKSAKYLSTHVGKYEQTKVHFKRVTGQQLIDAGYANVFDLRMKGANVLQKLTIGLFGLKGKREPYYFGEVVSPDEQYVIKLKKPIVLPNKVEADWLEEMILRYDYAQRISEGFGIEFVNRFIEQVINDYNAEIDRLKMHEASGQK